MGIITYTKGTACYDVAMADRIQTLHPKGKSGRSIEKGKYDQIKAALLKVLAGSQLTHSELLSGIESELLGSFDGNASWYAETVKLDLEARGIIGRSDNRPQKYFVV